MKSSRCISCIYAVDNSEETETEASCLLSMQPKRSEQQRASGIACGLGANEHPGKWVFIKSYVFVLSVSNQSDSRVAWLGQRAGTQ